jgi:hypothetical protein
MKLGCRFESRYMHEGRRIFICFIRYPFLSCVGIGMVSDGRGSVRRQRTVCYFVKINKETKIEDKVKKSEKDRGARR